LRPAPPYSVGHGRAEQAELAHLAHDLAVEILVEIGFGDARLQPLLRIAFGRVADEPLLVGKLRVERERIRPVEASASSGSPSRPW
jgi:hypothetical protein